MKKRHNAPLIAAFALLLLLPVVTFAGPVVRSGNTVSVAADQVIEGDFYGAGGTVSLSGAAEHDAYLAGRTVTVNAEVSEDLVVAGGTVQIHAPIGDDLRIVGKDVTVAGTVGGDLVVFGDAVKVLSTAQIEGDVLFFASDVDISGGVKGSVAGKAETVRVDAGIGGDLKVTASKMLTLGDRAEVRGTVSYKSPNELSRAQESVVVGEIMRESLVSDQSTSGYMLFLPLFITLFAALTAFLLFRPQLQYIFQTSKTSYGANGLIGLGVFLLVPMASTLLFVSILGLIPGIILLLSYVILLIISWVVAGIMLGTFVLKYFTRREKVSFSSVIIGILLFDLLILIPYVGILFAFAIFMIVLGGIARLLYNLVR